MLAKRIIPCLDVRDGVVVKGVQFKNHEVMGSIVDLAKRYADEGADELVFYDITASADRRRVDIGHNLFSLGKIRHKFILIKRYSIVNPVFFPFKTDCPRFYANLPLLQKIPASGVASDLIFIPLTAGYTSWRNRFLSTSFPI